MKQWIRDHPREVRGQMIHMTMEVKASGSSVEREERNHMTVEEASLIRRPDQERLMAKFVPKLDVFVETEGVRESIEKVKLWLNVGRPVHIIGPTGCGKTTLAMRVAEELNQPALLLNGDEQTTTGDLVGGYSGIDIESVRDRFIHSVLKSRDVMRAGWVNNALTLACKYGYVFMYNDFSRARPEANNVLLTVFQEGILELPTRFGAERFVRVHPDFKAILTSNSVDYAGVHRPQDALLDRMVGVYMDYYDFDTEVKIVEAHSGVSSHAAAQIVRLIRGLREKLPDEEKLGIRASIMLAQGIRALGGRLELLEGVCVDILATKVKGPNDLAVKRQLVREVIGEVS